MTPNAPMNPGAAISSARTMPEWLAAKDTVPQPAPLRDRVTLDCPICGHSVTFKVEWENETDDMGYTLHRYPVLVDDPLDPADGPYRFDRIENAGILDKGACRCDWNGSLMAAFADHINDDCYISDAWEYEDAPAQVTLERGGYKVLTEQERQDLTNGLSLMISEPVFSISDEEHARYVELRNLISSGEYRLTLEKIDGVF